MLDGTASEPDELRAQLERYDDLRCGLVAHRTLRSSSYEPRVWRSEIEHSGQPISV